MAGILDDIYKKLRLGSQQPMSVSGPGSTIPVASSVDARSITGSRMTQGTGFSSLSDQNGTVFGTSSYQAPRAPQSLAPTFQVPTSSPLSDAYNSMFAQNPASSGNPYPAFGSAPAGQITNPNVALPSPNSSPSLAGANVNVPAGADRLASPSLTAARNSDFFSDGRGGPTSALQSSGGLDRGGFENEARQRVAQDDYERRINTLAARNIYRDVAGGGDGSSRGRGDGNNRGSRRVYGAATPAQESIDVRTAKAGNSIRKDRKLLEQQSQGLAAVNSIETEKGALTNSEIDQRIKELEDMRRGL